jgi:2Fe-2S ferredoxin
MLRVVLRNGTVREVQLESGLSVMELCRKAGIDELEALCGGNCSCATCHVHLNATSFALFGPVTEDEAELLEGSNHREEFSRLSCQLLVPSNSVDIKLTIAPED